MASGRTPRVILFFLVFHCALSLRVQRRGVKLPSSFRCDEKRKIFPESGPQDAVASASCWSRRDLLTGLIAGSIPYYAYADDFSFSKAVQRNPLNPLTSKPLEMLRIMEQEDKNEMYGGELAAPFGPSIVTNTPGLLLVPIARYEALLKELRQPGFFDSPARWNEAQAVLATKVLPKKDFKKNFNNFADNIYYSAADPDRANAYLGGGATPSTTQTTQYMLRNEILGNVELAEQEFTYLINLREKKVSPSELTSTETLEDITEFLDKAIAAIDSYLKIPATEDVAAARKAVVKAESPPS